MFPIENDHFDHDHFNHDFLADYLLFSEIYAIFAPSNKNHYEEINFISDLRKNTQNGSGFYKR